MLVGFPLSQALSFVVDLDPQETIINPFNLICRYAAAHRSDAGVKRHIARQIQSLSRISGSVHIGNVVAGNVDAFLLHREGLTAHI